jgi:hypothetical protein
MLSANLSWYRLKERVTIPSLFVQEFRQMIDNIIASPTEPPRQNPPITFNQMLIFTMYPVIKIVTNPPQPYFKVSPNILEEENHLTGRRSLLCASS